MGNLITSVFTSHNLPRTQQLSVALNFPPGGHEVSQHSPLVIMRTWMMPFGYCGVQEQPDRCTAEFRSE